MSCCLKLSSLSIRVFSRVISVSSAGCWHLLYVCALIPLFLFFYLASVSCLKFAAELTRVTQSRTFNTHHSCVCFDLCFDKLCICLLLGEENIVSFFPKPQSPEYLNVRLFWKMEQQQPLREPLRIVPTLRCYGNKRSILIHTSCASLLKN